MFTGIIEEVGTVQSVSKGAVSGSLKIQAKTLMDDVKIGDSVAVNGVCLTATTVGRDYFTADVMAETFRRSSLGGLKAGSHVNLERAMPMNGRFGGHIVSGHIDGTGVISSFKEEGNAIWVTVETPKNLLKYIVEKGSIAIDGISLTVAYVDDEVFKVSIIPHTKDATTLLSKKVGDVVNLENDIVGKYVERFLSFSETENQATLYTKEKSKSKPKSGLSLQTLIDNGF